jgi:hypothetical protein
MICRQVGWSCRPENGSISEDPNNHNHERAIEEDKGAFYGHPDLSDVLLYRESVLSYMSLR